ncbi:helix-turn-helix domain-containing protein [Paenisporosarcina indica]|uniref:helix-turn-helix domain-containing protein n=1 Tax=Paenisporosarcina indica TaxID=650093 RepID=UPI000950136F|nr:helix-turn-helix domain-containing protein [Paenisporosarcina indica]
MLFQQIILHMVHRLNGERTISAPFHLLRGKRSGQTIQDVKSFGFTKYFSLFPKLSKESYDQTIQLMIQSGLLIVNEDSIPHTTKLGQLELRQLPKLKLNGWLYRGNERLFFQRLSLVTQTLSHVQAKSMAFTPVQKDDKIQQWVRQFLRSVPYQSTTFIQQFYQELSTVFQSPNLSDQHLTILCHRLSGFEVSGITWQQLSHALKTDELDLQIRFYECLHILLDEILSNPQLVILCKISEGIKTTTPLTDSAKKTSELHQQGYSFEQIVTMRQLKTSTIEDHFVEMAMNNPSFSIKVFFPNVDSNMLIQQVRNQQTKKLRTLKNAYPTYSYFQLRLLLVMGGDSNDKESL